MRKSGPIYEPADNGIPLQHNLTKKKTKPNNTKGIFVTPKCMP